MIHSSKTNGNPCTKMRFYEIHSDHLDVNMIHSSKSNGNPCMKMTVFIKTMKIHYVLKGINGETHTGSTKKRSRQQKARIGTSSFYLGFTDTFCKMYEIPAARVIRRGPSGSTIIIY